MDVTAIDPSTPPRHQEPAKGTKAPSLGKTDFLKLLTTQLTNQDPLKPVDNTAFIAQLAQFSSLEQVQNISKQLDSLIDATGASQRLTASSLVGKTVTFGSDHVQLTPGTPPEVQIKLDGPATVTARVQDGEGHVVRSLELGAQSGGTFDLDWDGSGNGGQSLPKGTYTITLAATDANHKSVGAKTLTTGEVGGITTDGSTVELIVGTQHVKLTDVAQISQ